MGKVTGFLEIDRQDRGYEKPEARARVTTPGGAPPSSMLTRMMVGRRSVARPLSSRDSGTEDLVAVVERDRLTRRDSALKLEIAHPRPGENGGPGPAVRARLGEDGRPGCERTGHPGHRGQGDVSCEQVALRSD